MRVAYCALVVAAACFGADEASDTAAIRRTVESLNRQPASSQIFTGDSDAPAKLADLYGGSRVAIGPRILSASRPTVVISHEPWGEAQIVMPAPSVEIRNPRVVCGAVRLITDDVAMVDASFVDFRPDAVRVRTPLVLVMRREGELWKIASLRVVSEP